MLSYILYGVGAVCVLGALQERKDFMRMAGFLGVAMIFGVVGAVIQFT